MGRTRKFVMLTRNCISLLKAYNGDSLGSYYGFPDDPKWDEWISAAYEEPGFLYYADEGDYLEIYRSCMNKSIQELNETMVRAFITYYVRTMRNHFVDKSAFIQILERWDALSGVRKTARND